MPDEIHPLAERVETDLPQPAGSMLVGALEEEDGLSIWPTAGPSKYISCLVGDDEATRSQRFACRAASDSKIKDRLNNWLEVIAWYAHKVELRNEETGEVQPATRLVLVELGGATISTCSGPMANLFRALLQEYGMGPWDPPLQIRPYGVPGKVGQYFQFRVRRLPKDVTPAPPSTTEVTDGKRTKRQPA